MRRRWNDFMAKGTYKLVTILFLVFALSLSGCQSSLVEDKKQEQEQTQIQEQVPFMTFANDFAYNNTVSSPMNASFTYGDLEKEGLEDLLYELDDFSIESIEEDYDDVEATFEQLKQYDYETLLEEEQMIYDLMAFQLSSAIESEEYLYYANYFNPSFGLQVELPLSMTQMELESKIEVEGYLERLKQLPRYFDQAIAFEQEKAKRNLLLPSYLYELSVEQIDGLTKDPKTFMIYQGFVESMDTADFLSDDEKTAYLDECYEIIVDDIFPSYEVLKEALISIGNMSDNQVGTYEFENSKAYYESLIYDATSYDMTVEEMETYIQDEGAKAYEDLMTLLREHPEVEEKFYEAIGNVASYDTIDEAMEEVKRITQDHFYNYGVESASQKLIPEFLEEQLPPGFYFVRSLDGEDYGNMYLRDDMYTDVNVDDFSTLLHENMPGHHLYFSVLYDSDEPLIQKTADWNTYSEGYAVQVQNLVYEENIDDPLTLSYLKLYLKLTYLDELYTDIEVHVHGMTKEELLARYAGEGVTEEDLDDSFNRMLANPGEVFNYYFGYLKLESYEEQFETTMGEAYDEKLYHDFILKHANIPFSALDGIVDNYLLELQ